MKCLRPLDRGVIWAAVIVIVLMCVFPPWVWKGTAGVSGHYGPITHRPENHRSIDYDRLGLQVGLVVLVAAAAMVTARRQ